MNTDSKLRRFIVLLDKAPFIIFVESPDYISISPLLRSMGFSNEDAIVHFQIYEQTPLLRVFAAINNRPDPIAYSIIEALADALPKNTLYFPVHFFTKSDWQNYIEWQNVDNKPEPTKDVVIAVCKLTHDLRIFNGKKPVNLDCDGEIVLNCLDRSAPFPQALLKECTMEIHDSIIRTSIGRGVSDKSRSKYISAMQTGHDSLSWVNLRQIEKNLTILIKEFGITIEE